MRKILITLILFFPALCVSAQGYINSTRSEIKEKFIKYCFDSTYDYKILENDTSVTLLLRDSSVNLLDIVVQFNHKGKCIMESHKNCCDSCFYVFLSDKLKSKWARWRKINERLYISRSRYRLDMEILGNNTIRFRKLSYHEFYDLFYQRKDAQSHYNDQDQ